MLWTVDTDILVQILQPDNPNLPQYTECLCAIIKLTHGSERVTILQQSIIELWNVLTRPATGNRPGLGLSIAGAEKEVRYLKGRFGVWRDVPVIYDEWRHLVVTHNISGVQVHDARLAAAAHMHGITHLLTYNVKDFGRYSALLTAVRLEDV